MKFPLFHKDGSSSSDSQQADQEGSEKLAARMEAAAQAADLAAKKAEMTAKRAEAAATKAEVLLKQVQVILDQLGQSVEKSRTLPAQPSRESVKDIIYSETLPPNERAVSESGIPLVAPFIVSKDRPDS
jgi:hypothetical protein